MKLPEFGVRRPLTNIMIFASILVLGIVSLGRLPIDLMPEIEPPAISIITRYEGASPGDVETQVTEIIENNVGTVSNLDKIISRSSQDISLVTLRFKWGINLDEASNEVRDKLEFAKRLLPEEIDTPIVFKFNTAMIPIIFIGVTAEQSYANLYHIVDKQVANNLKSIPGVGAVQLAGGLERQINVEIDKARLEAYHLSVQDIISKINLENISIPAGNLKVGLIDYTLRLPGEFRSPDEINNVIIGQYNGAPIYVKDVARVSDSFKEQTYRVRINEKDGLMLIIQKRSGANTVEVANRVKKTLQRIKFRLPADLNFYTLMDTSEYIVDSLDNLRQTVYWGGFLVILVVLIFLRQIRSSLIIALTIPFSLIISFVIMYFAGYTINIISLFSLAIAIGMVVDNAIVIVDNFSRHRERGEKPNEAAVFGASEVGLAITASTLTTVVVFLPMIFLKGMVGIMFKQLAFIVIATLMASLFTALTFSPMLCSKLFKSNKSLDKPIKSNLYVKFYALTGKTFEFIEDKYSMVLALALRNRRKTIALAFLILVFTVWLIPKIGTEFLPEEDTGDLNVVAELALGTRVEVTDKVASQIEDIFKKDVPEIKSMYARAGQASGGRAGLAVAFGQRIGPNIITVGAKLVKIKERNRTSSEIAEAVREEVQKIPGIVRLTVSSVSPLSRVIFGAEGKPVSVEIIGHDIDKTNALAEEMKKILADIKGVRDVTISRDLGKPELVIEIDRLKASTLGLDMYSIADTIRTNFYGSTAALYRESGDEYDIFVRLKEQDRQKIKDIDDITVKSRNNELIKLSNISRTVRKSGPIDIERQNEERIVKVEANLYKRSLGEASQEIRSYISKMHIPEGISIDLGAEAEEQVKSFRDLFSLLLLSVLLVYMVMASQFESLLDPFVVMFSIPFAFVGVAWALFLTGITLNMISFIGLIMLMGIVVNNAIVLVDYVNILRARGYSMLEAITQGCKNRLRPVLMTTLTTLFGLLPLAISTGEGSEDWRPIGVSMLGGLSVSTLVTLIIVPVLYSIFEQHIKKGNAKHNTLLKGGLTG